MPQTYQHITRRPLPETLSIRPGILVRSAALGRINGAERILLGAVRDSDFEMGRVLYGSFGQEEIEGLDSTLGESVTELVANGSVVQVRIRVSPKPEALIGLEPLPAQESAGIPVWPTSPTELLQDAARQANCRRRFEQQLDGARHLRRPHWIAAEMRHRADFPDWLPHEWRELIRENSRAWLELPSAPAGAAGEMAEPPQLPMAAFATQHPVLPQRPY